MAMEPQILGESVSFGFSSEILFIKFYFHILNCSHYFILLFDFSQSSLLHLPIPSLISLIMLIIIAYKVLLFLGNITVVVGNFGKDLLLCLFMVYFVIGHMNLKLDC